MSYVTTAALESERARLAKQGIQFGIEAGDFAAYGFYDSADVHRAAAERLHAEHVEVVNALKAREAISFDKEAAEFLAKNGREATEKARKEAWKLYYALDKKGYKFPIATKEAKRKALAYQKVLK